MHMGALHRATSTAWLMALFWGASAAHALSLRSSRAEADLGVLRPGGRTSYARVMGERLVVENAGAESVEVGSAVSIPPPGELLVGYEALPDPSWVRLDGASRTLAPGEMGGMDVVVSAPNDAGLDGRQFQFDCRHRGRDAGGGGLTLKTRLLFAVGEGDPPEVLKDPPEGFLLTPTRAAVVNVALGRRFPLVAGAGGLKLVNAGPREAKVRLSTLRTWPEDVEVPDGYARAPNPRWLTTGPPLTLKAGAVTAARLELLVPDEPRYRARRWTFLVAADADAGGRTGRALFLLNVETQSATQEARR